MRLSEQEAAEIRKKPLKFTRHFYEREAGGNNYEM